MKVEKLAHEVEVGDIVYSPNGFWIKVASVQAWGDDKIVLGTTNKTLAFTVSRYARFDVEPVNPVYTIELEAVHAKGEREKDWRVDLITTTADEQSRTELGHVRQEATTVQQMHKTPGFQSIARKTTHPLRWRTSSKSNPGRGSNNIETRYTAITLLIRDEVPDMNPATAQRIARAATVSK